MASAAPNSTLRYEPDEKCPPWALIGTAIQAVTLVLAPTILVVAVTVRASGQGESFLIWASFATLVIVGITMALQASKIGRLGGGQLIVCGVTTNYIPISIIALAEGGPAMLASLIVVSAIFYYAVAAWLPLLRRVITPTVAGTVLMLIAALILPFALNLILDTPETAHASTGTVVAAVTVFATIVLVLRAPSLVRPWSITLGIVAGCVVAGLFGIYEIQPLASAPWAGIPDLEIPGLDLTPGWSFWALLPLFLIVTLLQAIKNISDGMIVQRVSRRNPLATDFRLIQGSIYANGTGILMSGVAGTPPTSTYSSLTVPLINVTGNAARIVGYGAAVILLTLALFPKIIGALLTIPGPVMGGFLIVAIGLLFIEGIQTLVRAGFDPQKSLIAGISFAVGLVMQQHNLFADFIPGPWGIMLGNGITVGAATAIVLTTFVDLSRSRAKRLQTILKSSALQEIDEFLQCVGTDIGWQTESTQRLRSAGEEAFAVLSSAYSEQGDESPSRLDITARSENGTMELEFTTVSDEANIEDRLAYLEDEPEIVDPSEASLRLLRHYASSVRHQKYQNVDILTITVAG